MTLYALARKQLGKIVPKAPIWNAEVFGPRSWDDETAFVGWVQKHRGGKYLNVTFEVTHVSVKTIRDAIARRPK